MNKINIEFSYDGRRVVLLNVRHFLYGGYYGTGYFSSGAGITCLDEDYVSFCKGYVLYVFERGCTG